MKAKILKLELIGIPFIILLGSLFHFTFEWSNKFWLVGIFSAVNESTWEHLKLAVMPALLWLLIEIKILKEEPENFFWAKTKGIYSMSFFYRFNFLFLQNNLREKFFNLRYFNLYRGGNFGADNKL